MQYSRWSYDFYFLKKIYSNKKQKKYFNVFNSQNDDEKSTTHNCIRENIKKCYHKNDLFMKIAEYANQQELFTLFLLSNKMSLS